MNTERVHIAALFLDIGGVLLTNGWDHIMRRRAAEKFDLDYDEMNERHHLTFDTYEEGKLDLVTYLNRVVFYKERPFSVDDFRDFLFAQSKPYNDMIELISGLKARYSLKTVAVSNEGRELTVYRNKKYKLGSFIDTFISSCFVHFRKPDEDIFRMALNVSEVEPDECVYIEDRPMFVEVAQGLGIRGIWHRDYESTKAALEELGLAYDG
jgi:putative hydrolase of the HAD superfamily